jgi:hypothetical protein
MTRLVLMRTLLGIALLTGTVPAAAQVREVPRQAKGGQPQGVPWAEVPETFRNIRIPDWPVPTDLAEWKTKNRAKTRVTLLALVGEMPPRPDPAKVRVVSKEDRGSYTLERFEFHNGVDMVVPGILLVPKRRTGRVPAIVALHGHGSSKESVCTDASHEQCVGPMLAEKGYVVGAIDAYFNGERRGNGPSGRLDTQAVDQEESLFKLHLWQGRTLWGMMLRDQQCLIDYLATRPEVDPQRIAATGMSMGCTESWWLAAIDVPREGHCGRGLLHAVRRIAGPRQSEDARNLLLRSRRHDAF